jgi:hypothetical protein
MVRDRVSWTRTRALISIFPDLLTSLDASSLAVNPPSQVFRSLPPPSTSANIVQSLTFTSLVQLPPTPTIDIRYKDIQVAGDGTAIPGVPFTDTSPRTLPLTVPESLTIQSAITDSEPVPSSTSISSESSPLAISGSPSQMGFSSKFFTYTAPPLDLSESALASAGILPIDQNGVKATALHTIIGVSIGGGIALIFLVVGVLGARLKYRRIQLRVKRRAELRERVNET